MQSDRCRVAALYPPLYVLSNVHEVFYGAAVPSWAIKGVCLKINLQKFTYATRDRG